MINLSCDNCGKFVKKVTTGDVAKMRPNETFVCNKCLTVIEDWNKKVAKEGNDAITKINAAKQEAKAIFDKAFEDRNIQMGRR